ncbi:MAG TPA: HypC/HybG/HupF family hydrogenase formation chaperone [Nitriliruptorales bacterium]|nr:HypC/HybG/HupF family hydrogenase formation chaperone [Nitriliruptorales bacterium]
MTMPQSGAAAGALGPLARDLAAASLAMARRFSAGATMWCCSPTWPHHARHVAVEFVHPVIVGKRALPALMVAGPDVVESLRVSVRPGDIVLAVAGAEDPSVAEAMRRAHAWGVETIWIGVGPRPGAGVAHHVLWLPESEALAPYDGRFILLYHLLWELTHVCFEHPGLLKVDDPVCEGEVCITCSDEGRVGEVIAVRDDGDALVRTSDGRETVDTTLVGPVGRNDLVLIHAGSAISRLAPEVSQAVGP